MGERTSNSGKKLISTARSLKLDPSPSTCSKLKSNCVKGFNVRPNGLKLLKGKYKRNTLRSGCNNDFLNRSPVVKDIKQEETNETVSNSNTSSR
jgi:hypothetical protein